MERITYRITLDAYKNGIQRTLQGFETGDNVSRRLAINLVSGGDTFEIAQDVIAMIYVHNGSVPSINACEIVDNTIIYDVLPITEEGIFEMQVKLIEVGVNGAQKVLVAPKIAVEVTKSNTGDGGATGTTTFTALENALAKAEAVYNSRIIGVEIDDDCTFKVMYADGTVYENDYLKEALYNGNALLSESFAHGNTGIREGENTDNAKYYSNVSKSASEDAKIVSDEARDLLEEGRLLTTFTVFKVDFESGELTYMSANYNFDVNEETGNLEADPEGGYNPEELIGTVVDEFIDKKSAEINEKFTDNENKNAEQDNKLAECENKIAQLSNPNLLINGDFRVNQRNSTVVYSNNWSNVVYTVDRWHILGGGQKSANVTVNDGSITLKNTIGGQGAHFRQHLEESVYGTYTLTVKVKNLTGEAWARTQSAMLEQLHVGINTITFTDTPTTVGVSVEGVSSMEIEYIKLEQGSVATPFIPRLYAEELRLCQRYFQNNPVIYTLPFYNGKQFVGFMFPVEMRTKPTLKYQEYSDSSGDISTDISAVYLEATHVAAFVFNSTHTYISGRIKIDAEIY